MEGRGGRGQREGRGTPELVLGTTHLQKYRMLAAGGRVCRVLLLLLGCPSCSIENSPVERSRQIPLPPSGRAGPESAGLKLETESLGRLKSPFRGAGHAWRGRAELRAADLDGIRQEVPLPGVAPKVSGAPDPRCPARAAAAPQRPRPRAALRSPRRQGEPRTGGTRQRTGRPVQSALLPTWGCSICHHARSRRSPGQGRARPGEQEGRGEGDTAEVSRTCVLIVLLTQTRELELKIPRRGEDGEEDGGGGGHSRRNRGPGCRRSKGGIITCCSLPDRGSVSALRTG